MSGIPDTISNLRKENERLRTALNRAKQTAEYWKREAQIAQDRANASALEGAKQ